MTLKLELSGTLFRVFLASLCVFFKIGTVDSVESASEPIIIIIIIIIVIMT